MSPFAQSMFSRIPRSHAITNFIDKRIVVINIISLSMILMFFILYVVQVNSSVAKGYQMRELETKIHELTIENRQLQVAARQSQSLEEVSESVKMLGLIEADTPTYIAASPPSYALAE